MPKALKEKKRLHAPAADYTPVKEEPLSEYDIHKKNLDEIKAQLPPLPQPKPEEVEEDTATTEQAEAQQPKQLSKEEKRKQRRDKLLQKLNYASVEIQKQKEKKKPVQPKVEKEPETPLGLITKDLLSTLIEAEEKEHLERAIKRGDVKVKANHMTDKERQDLLQKEQQQFKSVTEHPVYKANPLATIREHLSNVIAIQKATAAKAQQQNNGTDNTTNDKNKEKDKKKPKTQAQQYTDKRKADKMKDNNQKDKKKMTRGIQKSPKQKKK